MNYSRLQTLTASDFRRYCGLTPRVFHQLVSILVHYLPRSGQRGGQPRFGIEDHLLIALEYWREYRTYFHIAQNWQTSEATVCRIVRRVEEALKLSGQCQLPGKTRLSKADGELTTVLVDVMESPIERPKKTKSLTTAASASSTRSNRRSSSMPRAAKFCAPLTDEGASMILPCSKTRS